MFYSRIPYTASAGQAVFPVPFPYLDKAYVEVRVAGVLQANYTWPTSTTIALPTGVPAGTIVEIRRNTAKAAKLVTFRNASMLTEDNLNTSADQVFAVVQEMYDDMEATVKEAPDGTIDARALRIKNGVDPVVGTDYATKNYVDVVSLSNINTVAADVSASAADAAASATQAANSATSAANSATSAANSATSAAASVASAATSAEAAALAAGGSATVAGTDATAAAASASAAAAAAGAASTSAAAASTSATSAAESATAAVASEANSAASATASAVSAAASATSATNSASSATASASSATASANSADTASTYATNSSTSATAAAASASAAAASAAAAAASSGSTVKVTATDTTPGALATKIVVTGSITKQVTSAGGDERLSIGVNVPVTSVFGRTGAVTITGADVTGALGYAPPNPNGGTYNMSISGNAATATSASTCTGAVSKDNGADAVGSYALVHGAMNLSHTADLTYSGSTLCVLGFYFGSSTSPAVVQGKTLSGTWRCLSTVFPNAGEYAIFLAQRIA